MGTRDIFATSPNGLRAARTVCGCVFSPSISLGFMPLNHIAGRVTLYQTLAKGGATTFVRRADMSTLFEDLARARPTSLLLVPRISNMVYGELST